MGRLVSVILVTWNDATFLPRCLDCLAAQAHATIELIAVDNASKDGSPEVVLGRLPGATVIRNEDNRGFAAAVNQAVRIARGEMLFLLNPDAALGPEYLQQLVEAFDRAGDSFGAATGKLWRASSVEITATERIDTKGIRMTRAGRHLDIGQGMPDGSDDRGIRPLGDDLFEVFGVSGAAAMYRRSFVDDVSIDGQFLDEDFFSYREDADVAWRGRVLGWRALYVPAAVGAHVRTVTPGARRSLSPVINMHSVKNRFLLRLKNESLYLAIRNLPFEIGRDMVAIAAVITVERTSLPALGWLWRNRRRVLSKRRMIQSRRRTSDRELARWFR